MSALTLPLKAVYFDQIKAGVKHWEYRLRTPFWTRRLAKAPFHKIILTLGYPAAGDVEKRLVLPWRGYVNTTITHPHFGDKPVEVFAIIVGDDPGNEAFI